MMYRVIFAGGALGSLTRELVSPLVPVMGPITSSLLANVVACFVIGWLFAIRHKVHAHVFHLGAVGFCGGLSTFSTFTAEIFNLVQSGHITRGLAAAAFEIGLGILAAVVGEALGRRYHKVAPR